MSNVVNLRLARKGRRRAAAATQAAANRALHGRTPAQRAADQAERTRMEASLDGSRREGRDDDR